MTEQNQNSRGSSNVKLVFDVMPDAIKGTGESVELQQAGKAMPSTFPPSPSTFIKAPTPPQAAPGPQSKLPSLWKFTSKYLRLAILILGVAALGTAGYFGYKYFLGKTDKESPDTADISGERPPEQPLPSEWLAKYFGKETCEEESCKAGSDPDFDGLKNTEEVDYGTDPKSADSDFDGVADGDETQVYNTDPKVADTDGDKFEDGVEVRNGYSPIQASAQPMATVERQVFEDNAEKYGLHEPTKTFVQLKHFTTNFFPSATSTPQLKLSVPANWQQDEMVKEANILKLNSEDHKISVSMTIGIMGGEPGRPYYLGATFEDVISQLAAKRAGLAMTRAGLKIGGQDVVVLETKGNAGSELYVTHEKMLVLQKTNFVFMVSVTANEEEWERVAILASTILSSVR